MTCSQCHAAPALRQNTDKELADGKAAREGTGRQREKETERIDREARLSIRPGSPAHIPTGHVQVQSARLQFVCCIDKRLRDNTSASHHPLHVVTLHVRPEFFQAMELKILSLIAKITNTALP